MRPRLTQVMEAVSSVKREAKEFLSAHVEARITATLSTGDVVDLKVKQAEFWDMTRNLVAKTLAPTRK